MGRPRRNPDDPPTPRTTKAKVNRVEVNDEGVRVLVEIEGLSALRAAQVMQAVLDLTFSGRTVETGTGSILDRARGGGGPEVDLPSR